MYLIANSLQNNILYKEHDYYNVLEWRSQDFPGRGFMNPKFGKFWQAKEVVNYNFAIIMLGQWNYIGTWARTTIGYNYINPQ